MYAQFFNNSSKNVLKVLFEEVYYRREGRVILRQKQGKQYFMKEVLRTGIGEAKNGPAGITEDRVIDVIFGKFKDNITSM